MSTLHDIANGENSFQGKKKKDQREAFIKEHKRED